MHRSQVNPEDPLNQKNFGGTQNPLVLGNMPYLDSNISEPNLKSLLNSNTGKRMYCEDEVLLLIKHIVKEFGNIMNKYCPLQTSIPLNNNGLDNLNSILLLSLLLKEQNNKNTLQNNPSLVVQQPISNTNFNSGFLNSLSSVPQMPSVFGRNSFTPLVKTNDLSMLLNCQNKKEENISSENLSKIPKIVSCTGMNQPNLDFKLGGNSHSENSFSSQLKCEVPKFSSEISSLKKYDSYQAETKEESYSNLTSELKEDNN